MAEINSWEPGINSPEENLYLRTLNEFRIEFENNVLFFIDYLHSIKKKKIDSVYLEYEMDYLNKLCKRYHKKSLNLKINSKKENYQVDEVLKLIKLIKKRIDYSYLDIVDLYYENFDVVLNMKLNKNISIILKELLIKYHHTIPKKFKKVPREKFNFGKKNYHEEIDELKDNLILKEFLKNIKISIDKMSLKVYDYLIETKLKKINSNKIFFLKKDFEFLGKKYFKQKYSVKINNKKPRTSEDKCLDETAANLLRFKEIFERNIFTIKTFIN